MKLIATCFFVLLLWGNTYSQERPLVVKLPSNVFFNEYTGKPFFPDESNIRGSPFLNTNWKLCIIQLKDGRSFAGVPIRLNILNQTVHYRTPGGAEMEVAPGIVTGIEMIDTSENGETTTRHFYNGFKPVGNNDKITFYEAVVQGKANLLHCRRVRIAEVKVLGLADQKEYQSSGEYYLNVDSSMTRCRKSASFFIELFADKKDEVEKYIDDQNLKFKSEKDYRRIVSYYNSLWKEF